MIKRKHCLPALFAVTLLSSCAQEEPVQYTEDKETATEATQKRRLFPWQTSVAPAKSSSLALSADATAFTMTLSGCVSTHTATVDETKAYLELYEFDRNCLVKLTTFTLNGKVYTPKAGSLFDTWQVGDIARFEVALASPADELTVTVVSTVTNPVTAAGSVHYQFSEITNAGTETIGEAVVRESASIEVNGQAAPNFRINQVQLVNITATGNGEFRFQLECKDEAVTGTGVNILCEDVLLSSIRLALVEDTYSGVPLDETILQNIFTAASGGKSIDMASEAFVAGAGTPALANGGFITANTSDPDVMVMAGTLPIVAHPNMILALQSGPSYTYFHVDVTLVVQSNDH